jgi:PhnB protein
MGAKVKAIPDEYRAATPYLIIRGATQALEFYNNAFGAIEVMRIPGPGGTVGHAEIKIGEARIMLADEFPEMGCKSPQTIGGTPVSIMIYVEDVDTFVKRAIDAGAKVLQAVENKFYGDRAGSLIDPYGHQWHIATHLEDVPMQELSTRAAELAQRSEAQTTQ